MKVGEVVLVVFCNRQLQIISCFKIEDIEYKIFEQLL